MTARAPKRSVFLKRAACTVLAATLGVVASVTASRHAHAERYPIAVLRGLDKVTARSTTIYAPVGEVSTFGTLKIRPEVCDKRPPEETPESAAFLVIVDERAGRPSETVFSGWMFASSPGLSALEHPVYDIWVLDCVNSSSSADDNKDAGGSP